jgi:hypothetical protein
MIATNQRRFAPSPVLDINATFVRLQKEPRPEDKPVLVERHQIVDLIADLADLDETAACLTALDLVVSVDSSAANLRCAHGCPTSILLCYNVLKEHTDCGKTLINFVFAAFGVPLDACSCLFRPWNGCDGSTLVPCRYHDHGRSCLR